MGTGLTFDRSLPFPLGSVYNTNDDNDFTAIPLVHTLILKDAYRKQLAARSDRYRTVSSPMCFQYHIMYSHRALRKQYFIISVHIFAFIIDHAVYLDS